MEQSIKSQLERRYRRSLGAELSLTHIGLLMEKGAFAYESIRKARNCYDKLRRMGKETLNDFRILRKFERRVGI